VGKWPEVKSHPEGLWSLLSVNSTFERKLAASGTQMSNSLHQRNEKVRRINVAELTQPIPARIYRAICHAVSAIDAAASPLEPLRCPNIAQEPPPMAAIWQAPAAFGAPQA
jgi:hypothetical protein